MTLQQLFDKNPLFTPKGHLCFMGLWNWIKHKEEIQRYLLEHLDKKNEVVLDTSTIPARVKCLGLTSSVGFGKPDDGSNNK